MVYCESEPGDSCQFLDYGLKYFICDATLFNERIIGVLANYELCLLLYRSFKITKSCF